MECLPRSEILEYHDDTLEFVRKKHGLDEPGAMAAAVTDLDNWVKSQRHFLKKDFPKHNLETILLSSKGSMDKAKSRIEKYCTFRSTLPQYFGDFDMKTDFPDVQGKVLKAVLPKQTKDYSRVFFIKSIGGTFSSNIFTQGTKIMFMFSEYLRSHDYNDGYLLVVDYRETNLFSLFTKLSPFELQQTMSIFIEGYGSRVKGIHYLTSSVIINFLISILKKIVNAKVASRICVHKDLDSLHKYIDKEILPEEYGGDERPLQRLHEEWVEVLSSEEFREYLREMNKVGVDNTLRTNEYL